MANTQPKSIMRYLLPAALWMLMITGLSVMPAPQLPQTPLLTADKWAHATVYAIFTWLILFGLQRKKGAKLSRRQIVVSVVFAALYGILMEFVQYAFVPGRFYEYADMLANTMGALLGFSLFVPVLRRKQRIQAEF